MELELQANDPLARSFGVGLRIASEPLHIEAAEHQEIVAVLGVPEHSGFVFDGQLRVDGEVWALEFRAADPPQFYVPEDARARLRELYRTGTREATVVVHVRLFQGAAEDATVTRELTVQLTTDEIERIL